MRRSWLVGLALAAVTVVVFWPALDNRFLIYDDSLYITENPRVTSGLSLANIAWAFTTSHAANWHPLTWISHMLDVEMFGLDPRGHHAMNVILHAINAALLFVLLRSLTGALWKSALVAALFALHPLRVESVAWAAERKDVLSTLFWFLASILYLGSLRKPGLGRSAAVVVVTALGLMTKPMLVTLPFLFLLFDYWPLGRLLGKSAPTETFRRWLKLLAEKTPLFLLSAGASLATFVIQRDQGAFSAMEGPHGSFRLGNALASYLRYLESGFWPMNLTVHRPLGMVAAGTVGAAAAVILAVTAAVFLCRRRHPYLLGGWLWYLGTLVPVIGVVQVGSQAYADRYSYVPLVGVALALVWGVGRLVEGKAFWTGASILAAACVLSALGLLTRTQLKHWRSSAALFEHALRINPDDRLVANNLRRALIKDGNYDRARVIFTGLREAQPSNPWVAYNFGVVADAFEDSETAVRLLAEASARVPGDPDIHHALGNVLLERGDSRQALFHLTEAVRLDPGSAIAHYDRGRALVAEGEPREAAVMYRRSLALNPDSADAHNNLGSLLISQGPLEEAERHVRRSLELNPQNGEAQNNLGIILARRGDLQGAIDAFQEALRSRPDDIAVRKNLEKALALSR